MRQINRISEKVGGAKCRNELASALNNLHDTLTLTCDAQDLEAAPRLRTTSTHTWRNAANLALATFCARWVRKRALTLALKAALVKASAGQKRLMRARRR